VAIVSETHVDRPPGAARARRNLETTGPADPPAESEEKFLDGQVAGVCHILARIAAELYAEAESECSGDGSPGPERRRVAPAALDLAHARLVEPDPRTECRLGQVPPVARSEDVGTQPQGDCP